MILLSYSLIGDPSCHILLFVDFWLEFIIDVQLLQQYKDEN